jgi:hypothetical protein
LLCVVCCVLCVVWSVECGVCIMCVRAHVPLAPCALRHDPVVVLLGWSSHVLSSPLLATQTSVAAEKAEKGRLAEQLRTAEGDMMSLRVRAAVVHHCLAMLALVLTPQ